MHYNLLFNGCSVTFGAELEGLNRDREYQRLHRFSHLVAEHFGMTYDNISYPGGSNDRIVKETIEWFEAGNTCDIAIIQLTMEERTVWYNNKKELKNISQTNFTLGFNMPKTTDLSCAEYYYYKEFYSDYMGSENYYKNACFLKNYFDLHNIKYIFISLDIPPNYNTGWQKAFKYPKITSIKNELLGNRKKNPENFCIDYSTKFKSNNNKNNISNIFHGVHPSELGHQKIANYLIEKINQV
jgi:hypothetical protein